MSCPCSLTTLQIFLHRVEFHLQYLTLYFRRLRYLAELVVRHNHAVIVVVADIVEERNTVLSLETLFISEQDTGIWVCRLI